MPEVFAFSAIVFNAPSCFFTAGLFARHPSGPAQGGALRRLAP
jgi:hypothetical protein